MTHKVRIPYVFVVRKVTWRPAGEPMPVDATPQLTVANGVSLPIEDMNLHIDPATYDALVEQGKREYYAEKAAKAKAARDAEEAQWEPMPIPLGASRRWPRSTATCDDASSRRLQPSPTLKPTPRRIPGLAGTRSRNLWTHHPHRSYRRPVKR